MFRYLLLALPLLAADYKITAPAAPGDIFFSNDGKSVTSRCRDRKVRTWDLASGKLLSEKETPAAAGMLSSDLLLAADPETKSLKVWDLTKDRQIQISYSAPLAGAAKSNDGRFIATSSPADRTVRIFHMADGKQHHSLSDGLGGSASLVFSPDGESVVSANLDNDVRVWKTKSGELIRKMEDMTGAMFAADFTPDGKQLVMAGLDETVYLFDAKSFALTRKLQGHGETISALAISPDSRTLVTGGFDVITLRNPVKIALWDLASGKIRKTFRSPHRVISLAFSPDAKWLAFTSGDNEISLIDLAAN